MTNEAKANSWMKPVLLVSAQSKAGKCIAGFTVNHKLGSLLSI